MTHKKTPTVPGIPLLGNIFGLIGDPISFILDSYRRFGPIFKIRVPGQRFTIMTGPTAMAFLAKAGEDLLTTREAWGGFAREVGVNTFLLALDGEEHRSLRKLMQKGMSRGTFSSAWEQARTIIEASVASIQPGDVIPVIDWMRRLITEMLGILISGRAPGDDFKHFDRFVKTILHVKVQKRWPRWMLWLPSYRRAKRRVLEVGQEIIDQWRSDSRERRKGNLISDVLAACEEDGQLLTPRALQLMVIFPYIAGLDTVANTCAFLLYVLTTKPEVAERVAPEIAEGFASSPTPQQMKQMSAFLGATMETLRIHPVSAMVARHAQDSFEFEGCRVEKGEALLFGTAMSHFMREFYPEPEKFDIDRFTPPRSEHSKPGAWAPFGLGPHTCLGAGLAEPMIMFTVGTLLHLMKFEASPSNYRLKLAFSPLPGPKGFSLKVVERK